MGGMNGIDVMDLGRQSYRPVLERQQQMVEQRRAGDIPDTLILVEHDPVYTLGRSADESHVLVPETELEKRGIDLVHIGRGGDVTFHGPGQIVGYPIIDLRSRGKGVLWYVGNLERVIQRVLLDYGIESTTDRRNRGVWVGDEKVAAIGVRIVRQVTMHGFALNVAVDLSYYDAIVPCGIRDKGVTSLDRLAEGVEMEGVKEKVVERFMDVFGESGDPENDKDRDKDRDEDGKRGMSGRAETRVKTRVKTMTRRR